MSATERPGVTGDPARLRAVLALASSTPEPRIDRFIQAIPALLSKADALRRGTASFEARILAAGWFWIPRLVSATALLVCLALIWSAGNARRQASAGNEADALDRWLVSGSISERASDPVVDALLRPAPKDQAR
jgi:hypothetical protein